ncbi:MAG: periplasmic sensor signal transduction histidine kinase [Betaproteobacteria bacterium]|nr:periplasmic sensor signal transduction histidine kinase [Betaproteobacteria bacterium]
MLTGSVIVLASFVYVGLLFAIAYYGDKRADAGRSIIANPYIYTLSLAVYCTSWTFYGSVGRAATSGIGFLPIFLGPTLMAVLWWYLMVKMIRISKANRITSIADFVASRYGKSQLLGGLVTVIAVIGIVPYISLQLKAVSNSFSIILKFPALAAPEAQTTIPLLADNTFYIALLLAVFTILFGTRHLDASERHEGLVAAIAFESVVKLLAFIAVGVYVTYVLYDGFADIFSSAVEYPQLRRLLEFNGRSVDYSSWASLTFLSMLAIMFLPRQFQVAVVENVDERHLKKAVWLFPLYLFAINVFVLPIAFAGLMHFPAGNVDADTFVLNLPIAQQQSLLTLIVFIGGLSAATGMVIVETIALSTMVCNNLAMPLLLRLTMLHLHERADLSALIVGIRRGAIVGLLLLGYAYFRLAGEAYALVSIGLISFSAVAQFAPAIIGGMFWKGATRRGAICGLLAGFTVWTYTLLLPSFAKSGWLPISFVEHGAFGLQLLKPLELFGLTGLDDITHCLFWSMFCNIGAYVFVSLLTTPSFAEQIQAALFVDSHLAPRRQRGESLRGDASVNELISLLGRFLGQRRAHDAFAAYARKRGAASADELRPDTDLIHFAETLLAGAIGAGSANVVVASVVQEEPLGIDKVMNILDETSQALAYSRQLEQKSRELEVATAELRSANAQLQELDRLKDDFVSTVTHELRTPLTSIRAFSEILQDNPMLDLPQRAKFLGIITRESERLTRLINQVLDLAKLESANAEWHTGQFDLQELIEDASSSTSQLFLDKSIAFEFRLPSSLPPINADRDRLLQVMLNLLSNAAKFCHDTGGKVSVTAALVTDGMRIDVVDNGVGISAEDQALIFEKFRQVGDTLTQKPQGTGLGLPICRQIIQHFGGRLWVDSAPGRGATFSFVLPNDCIGAAHANPPSVIYAT